VGERVTPTWVTLRDFSSMRKKATSGRKQRSVTWRPIAGPHISSVIMEKGRPLLPRWREAGERAACTSGSCGRHTRIPSLGNSPRMRSAPQSRFLLAISLINAIVSGESFGCLESVFDLCFQNKRKSSRCHRSTVSGCTIKSACFQVRSILARNDERNLSVFLQTGRLTCRCRIVSCCRNNAFSTSSSDFPLVRSVIAPCRREMERGFIQRTMPSWSA
jgi:hypothetical protein